jgi:hypothetical protein
MQDYKDDNLSYVNLEIECASNKIISRIVFYEARHVEFKVQIKTSQENF